jgi:hypothetical protein
MLCEERIAMFGIFGCGDAVFANIHPRWKEELRHSGKTF